MITKFSKIVWNLWDSQYQKDTVFKSIIFQSSSRWKCRLSEYGLTSGTIDWLGGATIIHFFSPFHFCSEMLQIKSIMHQVQIFWKQKSIVLLLLLCLLLLSLSFFFIITIFILLILWFVFTAERGRGWHEPVHPPPSPPPPQNPPLHTAYP